MMKLIKKSDEKIVFTVEINTTLANAIRRSVNEIPILAIDEVDIYKNDSALYDQILAHRLGLIPLKNEKLKQGETINLKLKAEGEEVLSKKLGKEVVYGEMPIVLLEKEQELEVVARARQGKGNEHAKFSPGIVYYRHLPKITIEKEGEKHKELAELYPDVFEFDTKLKVKNEWVCDLDEDDVKDFKGVSIEETEQLVFFIESWGQIDASEMFTSAVKELESNLNEVSKAIK